MKITSIVLNKVTETIDKYRMIDKGDSILVAISGGPDSVCLLHALYSIRERYKIKLYAAHINHNLRGNDSDEDVTYVKDFCEKLDIKLFVKSIDVKEISKRDGISLEAAGRQERYGFFFEVVRELGDSKIAVAHNMNDQAETMLMRFLRGTGLEGLSGIKPVREDGIIRPLIQIERTEIEQYCKENDLKPRLDESNLEPIFTRNKIRLELIPLIVKEYNPKFINIMATMADNFRDDNNYLNRVLEETLEGAFEYNEDSVSLSIDWLLSQNPSIQNRIIRKAIEKLLGSTIDIESKHIDNVKKIINKQATGLKVDLPREAQVEIVYNRLFIKRRIKQNINYEYPITLNQSMYIKELDASIFAFIINADELKNIDVNCKIAAFDFDKIVNDIYIRSRQQGDKFVPLGMKGTKKVKDFFMDCKIPRSERNKIPLLASKDEVIWVVGYRINDRYKCTNSTKKILVVRYSKGGNNN